MRTQTMNPKLLFQFYRGQKVPPLIKKQSPLRTENKSPFSKYRSISNNSAASMHSRKTMQIKNPKQNILKIHDSLQKKAEENQELRLIIQELTEKSDMLQQINERLVNRINELQKQNKSLTQVYDLEKRSAENRVKGTVYIEIQEYLRSSIEKFMTSLRKEKMSPIVENKIQGFLEQIININQHSVEKYSRVISAKKNQSQTSKDEVNIALKDIIFDKERERSLSKSKQTNNLYGTSSKYQTIFEKLNHTNLGLENQEPLESYRTQFQHRRRSPSFMDADIESSPIRSRIRPKIFNQKYATDTKNRTLKTEWK